MSLYKKSFSLRISSVHVTFTEEFLNEKFNFLCSVSLLIKQSKLQNNMLS